MAGFLTAAEGGGAARRQRATLYAYVSRGLVRAARWMTLGYGFMPVDAVEQPGPCGGAAAGQRRTQGGARFRRAGASNSAITLIRDGRLWLPRCVDALVLAETAELEHIAALLWELPRAAAFGPSSVVSSVRLGGAAGGGRRGVARALRRLGRWRGDGGLDSRSGATRGGMRRAGPPHGGRSDRGGCSRSGDPRPMRRGLGTDRDGAQRVRKALNLSADHELNASSFTVRCVASTGASLHAVVVAGLAALSGPRHGGMSERVESLFTRPRRTAPQSVAPPPRRRRGSAGLCASASSRMGDPVVPRLCSCRSPITCRRRSLAKRSG